MSKFKSLANSIRKSWWYSQASANAIAASIGRKKYWAKKFASMAAAGRRRK